MHLGGMHGATPIYRHMGVAFRSGSGAPALPFHDPDDASVAAGAYLKEHGLDHKMSWPLFLFGYVLLALQVGPTPGELG
jgi:hypothetical protein